MFHTIYPNRRKKTHGPASVGKASAKWYNPNPETKRGSYEFQLTWRHPTGATSVLAECRASSHASATMIFQEQGLGRFHDLISGVVRLNWSFRPKE